MSYEFYYDTLFKLEEPFHYALSIYSDVQRNMIGRLAGKPYDYGLVAQALVNSGGNYLEIGTLFGGGLIIMAKVMEKFGIDGKCVAIDPLDGYYGKGNVDPVKKIVPTKDIVLENAKRFGVLDRIEIIQKPSYPFPEEAKKLRYGVAFIDGDHWGDMPWKDFLSVEKITDKYIIFDNYDKSHPAVVEAVIRATGRGWLPVHISSITVILEKNPKLVDRFARR